ncbi:hypothetical protein Rhopal_001379-T1 [Rhodotorula paludigena]|uniref:Nuclear rim protein 1 n=1 Tax=Rhodotorula paludigena TaxID=86838 RepID=A0AAV5GDN8_9BASI|nr:hypothetical protein Rhopal_001379-T1 [Rhodotorula paludigena]
MASLGDSPARTPARPRHSALESRRALGARDPGTPVGRLLTVEGIAPRSPRKVRTRPWYEKAREWPNNTLLSLETSLQLLSFDAAGYPAGVAAHLVHFLLRLSTLVSVPSLPSFIRSSANSASRYARRPTDVLGDADARLEALQRQTAGRPAGGWSAWAWWLSVLLVLLSLANTVYLVSQRRKYQLVLRKDPIASPNARASTLDFSPSKKRRETLSAALKKKAKALVGMDVVEESHIYPVQELNVWTPERVLWSLRFFTLYSPPVALLYHFVTPATFILAALCGTLFVLQTFLLVHLYSTLVSDRATLQAEVMHEYNAKFVHPRVFAPKRDACVQTSQAERIGADDWLATAPGPNHPARHAAVGHLAGEDEGEYVTRGSGRKIRRGRESAVPSREGIVEMEDSPAPRRVPRATMLG